MLPDALLNSSFFQSASQEHGYWNAVISTGDIILAREQSAGTLALPMLLAVVTYQAVAQFRLREHSKVDALLSSVTSHIDNPGESAT